jgi:RHS repeat-associated protein
VVQTNKDGTAIAVYSYQPRGAEVSQTQPDQTVHDTNPWRFAGGEYDNNSLYHFGARYYNTPGQWWQQDSYPGQILDPNSTNRYAYAGDNPLSHLDLSGRDFSNFIGGLYLSLGATEILAAAGEIAEAALVAEGVFFTVTLGVLSGAFIIPGGVLLAYGIYEISQS